MISPEQKNYQGNRKRLLPALMVQRYWGNWNVAIFPSPKLYLNFRKVASGEMMNAMLPVLFSSGGTVLPLK